jgi:hypothetical protein
MEIAPHFEPVLINAVRTHAYLPTLVVYLLSVILSITGLPVLVLKVGLVIHNCIATNVSYQPLPVIHIGIYNMFKI